MTVIKQRTSPWQAGSITSFLQVPKKHQIPLPQLCSGFFQVSLCTDAKGATSGPAALQTLVNHVAKAGRYLYDAFGNLIRK